MEKASCPITYDSFNFQQGSWINATPKQKLNKHQRGQEWKREMLAGMIAGMYQSVILTPLEVWQTNITML